MKEQDRKSGALSLVSNANKGQALTQLGILLMCCNQLPQRCAWNCQYSSLMTTLRRLQQPLLQLRCCSQQPAKSDATSPSQNSMEAKNRIRLQLKGAQNWAQLTTQAELACLRCSFIKSRKDSDFLSCRPMGGLFGVVDPGKPSKQILPKAGTVSKTVSVAPKSRLSTVSLVPRSKLRLWSSSMGPALQLV